MSNLIHLFEQDSISGYISLQKADVDDKSLIQMFSVRPGELNILFARTADFLRGNTEKTKKDLINDILEVLERSSIARKFVGIGLNQEYKLFKGFPVRKGDPYESMPAPGSELILKPVEVYIQWSTDAVKAREMGAKFDAAKGEPIGGLLVRTQVDAGKLLFDINAVTRAIKAKYQVIEQYNNQAAPGRALSKANTSYLAKEAPNYQGEWEIITTNKIVNTVVEDKWTWDSSAGKKTIKWATSSVPSQEKVPPSTPEDQQTQKIQEKILSLFESTEIDEGFKDFVKSSWQSIKNVGAEIAKTERGLSILIGKKKIEYLQSRLKVFDTAEQYIKLMGQDQKLPIIEKLKTETNNYINQAKQELGIAQEVPVPKQETPNEQPVDNKTSEPQSPISPEKTTEPSPSDLTGDPEKAAAIARLSGEKSKTDKENEFDKVNKELGIF